MTSFWNLIKGRGNKNTLLGVLGFLLIGMYSLLVSAAPFKLGSDSDALPIAGYRNQIKARLAGIDKMETSSLRENKQAAILFDTTMRDVMEARFPIRSESIPMIMDLPDAIESIDMPIPLPICIMGTDEYSQWWLRQHLEAKGSGSVTNCLIIAARSYEEVERLRLWFPDIAFNTFHAEVLKELHPSVSHYPVILKGGRG